MPKAERLSENEQLAEKRSFEGNCENQTTDIKSDGGYRLITIVRFVSRDQFYLMRARRNYSVGYNQGYTAVFPLFLTLH